LKPFLAVAAKAAEDGTNNCAPVSPLMPEIDRVAGTANALLITSLRFIEISLIPICSLSLVLKRGVFY
jgi:hypothetical protein